MTAREGGVIVLPGVEKLTLSGEFRLRYEGRFDYDFADGRSDANDFFTQRVRVGFDFDVTDALSVAIQLQDVRDWGEETSTTDASADGLDLKRGFVQLRDVPGLGGTGRAGRQVLSFGDERLIGGLEWLSQGRSFDGYSHTWSEAGSWSLDVFATQVAELATPASSDAFFAGGYATFELGENGEPGRRGSIDLYLLYRDDQQLARDPAGDGPGGREHLGTWGARWFERCAALELELEGATQFGERDDLDVPFGETYALHAHATWHFDGELAPWLRAEIDVASGDDPSTRRDERFDVLFPTAHKHWGMMDFAVWENMLLYGAATGLRPCQRSRLSLGWFQHRALEETDAYRGPNNVLSAGVVGGDRYMGDEFDVFWEQELLPAPHRAYVQAGYGVFVPGDGVRDARGSDDVAHFAYVEGGVRF